MASVITNGNAGGSVKKTSAAISDANSKTKAAQNLASSTSKNTAELANKLGSYEQQENARQLASQNKVYTTSEVNQIKQDLKNNLYGRTGGNGDDGSKGEAEEPVTSASISNALANYWKQQNNTARTNALNALAKRLNLNIANYENELSNVDQNYQALINANEVSKYKARSALRESQANRGVLDSGLGRQEALNQYTNYANQNVGIQTQREADKQTIRNAIASLKADYESDKAEIENQYNNALLQLMANE